MRGAIWLALVLELAACLVACQAPLAAVPDPAATVDAGAMSGVATPDAQAATSAALSPALVTAPASPASPCKEGGAGPEAASSSHATTQTAGTTGIRIGETVASAVDPVDQNTAVVFLREGNAWLWRPDRPARALSAWGDVDGAWLSDDLALAAVRRAVAPPSAADAGSQAATPGAPAKGFELWRLDVVTGAAKRLVDAAEMKAHSVYSGTGFAEMALAVEPVGVHWVPGTHVLGYASGPVPEDSGIGPAFVPDLHLVDADTGAVTTLAPAPEGGQPTWSIDGRRVALGMSDRLALLDRTSNQRVTSPKVVPEIAFEPGTLLLDPRWTTGEVALRSAVPEGEGGQQGFAIYEFALPDLTPRLIGRQPMAALGSAVLAPGADWAAFLVQAPGPADDRALHIASADGQLEEVYAKEDVATFGSWAPDGNSFTFRTQVAYEGAARPTQLAQVPNGLWLGRLCHPPVLLTDHPWPDLGGEGSMGRSSQWLDVGHVVFPALGADRWQLRVADLDGKSEAIGDLSDVANSLAFQVVGVVAPPVP